MPRSRKQKLAGRKGPVFAVRMTADERAALEAAMMRGGPRALGPWLVRAALAQAGVGPSAVLPRRRGTTATAITAVIPARVGNTRARVLPPPAAPPKAKRIILDLCAGTGAWSEPYKRAGYKVIRVTLPKRDVRTFVAPRGRVWGVLCAPPCQEFSMARNGSRKPRDFARGLECVNACLRIVLQTRPTWWALENPVGKLSIWLGPPRDTFEPCDFGDPWTKRTALWGDFVKPERGPYVKPARGATQIHAGAKERARTPRGFARAFFKANP